MKDHALVTTRTTAALRERIASLRSRDMVRLAPERELAAELRVSRESLRTSIKKLVDEGLLVQKQGSGTYILPRLGVREIHLIKASDIKRDDPFYMAFLSEVAHHTSLQNVPLLMVQEASVSANAGDACLVILGYLSPSAYERARRAYRRIVAVQGHPMYKDITQVDVNYYKIGYDAGLELARHNHRVVLHLAGPDEYPAATARRRGFQDAVKQTGVTSHTIKGKMNWNFGYSIGDTVATEYLRAMGVTGVFSANDWMAIGLMNRLSELRVRVPGDVSIIGCDDIRLAAEVIPALTTFREDFQLLIGTVYQQLNEMATSGESASRQILLPAQFIARDSLRAL